MPIPPAASRLIKTASTAAPRAVAGIGSRRQSGVPERTASQPACTQDQPAKKQVALEGIQTAEHDSEGPAAQARAGDQPGHVPRLIGRSAVIIGPSGPGAGRDPPRLTTGHAACRGRVGLDRICRSGAEAGSRVPKQSAAARASRAQTPAVAQTSRNRLCGSRISSLACGSLYFR